MDLITQLPSTAAGHDAIVVFVDKLTKMIHAVPTTTTVTAPILARIFFDHVFRLHGLPKVIVSDRDPRFTAAFWKELFHLTGTHLNMSTANHPQTDGQTERANRTLEDMLRNFVAPHHDDWDTHLTAAGVSSCLDEHASIIDGETHFHVQEFRNHRFQRRQLQLQVKWLGHPDHENSWLPLTQLQQDLSKGVLKKLLDDYARRTKQPKNWKTAAKQ
ncbi:hypothetical protein QJQ45_003946 [Haematococcus lacustris]|nr:hypothetical protein QJQ45_003946 [Haematococcus lacustris]